MSFEYKDILELTIALLGVVVAIIAYRTADRADNTANRIAFRSLRHESLQKYAELIAGKKRSYRPWFQEIEAEAMAAYSDIIGKVDDFGLKPENGRHLRHVANDIVILFFNAFSREMPWSPPINICPRIGELFHLRYNLENKEIDNGKVDFKAAYNEDRLFLDDEVWRSQQLKELAACYSSCLRQSKEAYSYALDRSAKVRSIIDLKRNDIKKDIAELSEAVDQNELDEIKLEESSGLWSKYREFQRTLEFYDGFPMIENKIVMKHEPNQADQVILIAFTMLLIHQRARWGHYIPN